MYRNGFAQWWDSSSALALDKDSVRELDKDGRLHVSRTRLTKANICPYFGKEIPNAEQLGLEPDKKYMLLRDPDELQKAVKTANNMPLLSRHVPLSADNHNKDIVVGATGTDAEFEDPYLYNSIVIWPAQAIESVDDDSQREISAQYHYSPDMTPGTYKGQAYDGVMRDIVFNAFALVPNGRAGSDVLVADAAIKPNWSFKNMAGKKYDFSGFRKLSFDAFAEAKDAEEPRNKFKTLSTAQLREKLSKPGSNFSTMNRKAMREEIEWREKNKTGKDDASTSSRTDPQGTNKPSVLNKGQPVQKIKTNGKGIGKDGVEAKIGKDVSRESEGRKAFVEGKKSEDNPYPRFTSDNQSWIRGWLLGRANANKKGGAKELKKSWRQD